MLAEIRPSSRSPAAPSAPRRSRSWCPTSSSAPRPDGAWLVELNPDTLPRVLVNQIYYARVSKTAKSEADKTFLADCLQTANWLTRCLDQRARTILKVATEIVRQQDGFFRARRRASAPAQPEDRRRRDRHARIDRLAGDLEQGRSARAAAPSR